MTRYVLDRSTRRLGGRPTIIGGSPLRLFRLSTAGLAAFQRIAAGADEPPSVLTERLVDAGAIHPQPRSAPYGLADVTVVVPALRPHPAALAAIADGCAGTAALLVVDDGSDPPIPSTPGGTVVRLRATVGPAVARNAGLGAVTTPLVAFVDTDVTPAPGWLDPLLGHFADDRVALVAPRVASRPGPTRLQRYEVRWSPLDLGREPGLLRPGSRLSYAPGAALVARTAAVRAVGGFDRRLRVGEDVDLIWRLGAAGWRCRYEPAAVVHHAPRATWRDLVNQRVAYGSSAAPLAARHAVALAPVRVSGWTLGVWGLALAGRPAAALATAGGTAAALAIRRRELPPAEAVRLVLGGHARAGALLAGAARRVWWPALAIGALASSRMRRLVVVAALLALVDGGPARLLDDLAYGVGVWKGVLAGGEIRPLLPRVTSWPRRSVAVAAVLPPIASLPSTS